MQLMETIQRGRIKIKEKKIEDGPIPASNGSGAPPPPPPYKGPLFPEDYDVDNKTVIKYDSENAHHAPRRGMGSNKTNTKAIQNRFVKSQPR